MNKITLEELKERLDYNPDTGIFTWKTLSPSMEVAGGFSTDGYVVIGLNYKLYKAHRLAWLYMTGEWPKNQIDHINQIKHDNRFCNLREATNYENGKNLGLSKSNKSGYRGVSWHRLTGKWRARITLDNKTVHLGLFTTPEEANEAAIQARKKYYGEFSDNL